MSPALQLVAKKKRKAKSEAGPTSEETSEEGTRRRNCKLSSGDQRMERAERCNNVNPDLAIKGKIQL